MNILNRLAVLLSSGLQKKYDERLVTKVVFINLLSLAGFILFLAFGIMALLRGEYFFGAATIVSSALLLSSIHYVRKTGKYINAAKFNLTLVILVLFTMFASDQTDSSVIIWFSALPVLSVIILGIRNGTAVSLTFLIVIILFFILPETMVYRPDLPAMFIIRFFGLYSAMYVVAIIFEHYRMSYLKALELKLLEARNETRLKESFISKLSHQIRTPLSNIMLVGHMVNKVNLTPEQREMMETIIASANNLVSTIENIAEITEVDIESEKRSEKTRFNLLSTLESSVRLFTVQKEPVVDFNLSVGDKLKSQELEGDPVRLKQVFLNLIETILKNKRPGKININILADIHGQISDITEIRFELRTDKPINLVQPERAYASGGSGFIDQNYGGFNTNLDLNIARKIIIQLGGKLHVLQTKDKNQVFLFTLPFRAAATMAPSGKAAVMADKEKVADTLKAGEKLRDANLLLVEDNTINQKIVVLSLNKYIKNIDVANNGKEALDKFGTSKYDVILMDVQMPVIDGFVATRKIREIEATTKSHTPIIAITANALHGDREKCLAAGMDDYISKPFQVEVLVEKIRSLLPGKS
ncbi:MAG: response regulator [Marinilabiliales bacterium]|nr:MAG: response regulator [Marinilabiliales bacterium]